MFLSHLFRK